MAIGRQHQRELTAKPTENLAAYDEYFKGEAASQAMGVSNPADPPPGDRVLRAGGRARLDVRDRLGAPLPRPARCSTEQRPGPRARRAGAARGGAGPPAQPNEPLGYRALGRVLPTVDPRLRARARGVRAGCPARPRQRQICSGRSRPRRRALGRWDSAAARLSHAALLDPRSATSPARLAASHWCFGATPRRTRPPTARSRWRRQSQAV